MSRPWEQIALFDLHQPSAPDPDTVEATEIDAEQDRRARTADTYR